MEISCELLRDNTSYLQSFLLHFNAKVVAGLDAGNIQLDPHLHRVGCFNGRAHLWLEYFHMERLQTLVARHVVGKLGILAIRGRRIIRGVIVLQLSLLARLVGPIRGVCRGANRTCPSDAWSYGRRH